MYFTPGNEFYTAAKPEVYIYLDYIDIKGEKDLCVYLTLDLNVIAVYILTKHPICGKTIQF